MSSTDSTPGPALVSAARQPQLAWRGYVRRTGLAALIALAWLPDGYWLYQLSLAMASAVALLGLVLLTGRAGQVSLGQGAFVALGAYLAAVVLQPADPWPAWLGLPLAALAGFAAGWLLGYPALRLSGHLLALATFALAIAVPQLLRLPSLVGITGGSQGLILERPAAPQWLEDVGIRAGVDAWVYLLGLLITLPMWLLAHRLASGPPGRAWSAARDHPLAATSLGMPLARVRAMAFAIAAAYAAVAGVLHAWAAGFVSPDSFPVFLSISLLVGLVVGGTGSVGAVLIGAAFIHLVPQWASGWSNDAPWAIYGLMMVVSVWLMPDGVAGRLQAWRSRGCAGAGAKPQQRRSMT
jgi:branched-chain amino acid transport system permease protein